MNLSIASITTAFNASRVLPRQIDALLSQSRPLQEIVIVDNGSTDNTSAMLAERYPQVTVLSLPENTGASGGCAAGLAYAALEKRHDWVWNFDNDSVPGEYALEMLLSGAGDVLTDHEVGMLAPLPVHAATGISYPPLFWREGFVRPAKHILQQTIWFADLAIASGCLVRREVVGRIDLPRADFFMDFFDFEYCLRMRTQGYKIGVISGCQFSHEIGNALTIRFLGYSHTWSEHVPWREYYLGRNLIYLTHWLYPTTKTKRFGVLLLFRHAIAIILFGHKKLECLKKLIQGIYDGRHGRLGIRFLP